MSNKEPSPGPFESTTTKTIELSPIKFTVTETTKSTHVPPAPCGCGGGSSALGAIMDLVQQYAAQAGSSSDAGAYGVPTVEVPADK